MKMNAVRKYMKIIFCLSCILAALTGCRTREYSLPSNTSSADVEKAIKEEEEVMNNPPIANCTSEEVVQALEDNHIEVDVKDSENGDGKIINSKKKFYCIEIYDHESHGKKGVNSVYITVNSKKPLESDDLWNAVTNTLNVLFTEICGTYNEEKIIDSLQALSDNKSDHAVEHLNYDSSNQVVFSYVEEGKLLKKQKVFINLIHSEN